LSEKAGVVNIALEGSDPGRRVCRHLGGQGSLFWACWLRWEQGLLGLLHAFLTQKTRMNHVVSGLGITLLSAGATRYLFSARLSASGVAIAGLDKNLFLILALVLPFAVYLLLMQSALACVSGPRGEPGERALWRYSAAPSRFAAVMLVRGAGALAGAYLSMGDAHLSHPICRRAKGYIALPPVIFGKGTRLARRQARSSWFLRCAPESDADQWNPSPLLGIEWTSPFLLRSLPYLMTLAALVSVVGRPRLPPRSARKGTDECHPP